MAQRPAGQMQAGPRSTSGVGYGLGVVGLAIFFLAGIGDGVWHTVRKSRRVWLPWSAPRHLVLLVGGMLIVTSLLRAAWQEPSVGQEPSFRSLLPVLGSAALAVAVVFFLASHSAFAGPTFSRNHVDSVLQQPSSWLS